MGLFDRIHAGSEPAADVHHRDHVLLTSRRSDPTRPAPGFHEIYACTRCGDQFVLAWQPKSAQFAATYRPVTADRLPRRHRDLSRLLVFCPVCRTDHSIHGPVLWPTRATATSSTVARTGPTAPS